MASLKEIKNRISSVRSTRQITSAMKMVASAKLHKAQGRVESMLPYQQKLNELLADFLTADVDVQSPYTVVRSEVKRVAVVVCASNTSLCGAFNANVAKQLEQTLTDYKAIPRTDILLYPVGKKAEEAVRKAGFEVTANYRTLADKPTYAEAAELAGQLMALYAAGEVDKVELIYHHFKSTGSQVLTREVYLPLDLKASESKEQPLHRRNDYIVEPSPEALIAELLPKVLSQKLYTVFLDSNTSEHAARMLAMQTATDNANELIQELTKQYNKTRQQTITNELLDIVAGSMK